MDNGFDKFTDMDAFLKEAASIDNAAIPFDEIKKTILHKANSQEQNAVPSHKKKGLFIAAKNKNLMGGIGIGITAAAALLFVIIGQGGILNMPQSKSAEQIMESRVEAKIAQDSNMIDTMPLPENEAEYPNYAAAPEAPQGDAPMDNTFIFDNQYDAGGGADIKGETGEALPLEQRALNAVLMAVYGQNDTDDLLRSNGKITAHNVRYEENTELNIVPIMDEGDSLPIIVKGGFYIVTLDEKENGENSYVVEPSSMAVLGKISL